jgi:16S rRNA (guanine527-N7)-methyltransferase
MSLLPEDGDRTIKDLAQRLRPILVRSAHLGFLGGMTFSDLIEHALGFCQAAEDQLGRVPNSALDLGAGGGIPGLVLAAVWPETDLTLLDSSQRRTDFLTEEIYAWGISDRVTVVTGRAGEAGLHPGLSGAFELVTARAFGSPAATAECAAPFLDLGGILIASEPPETRSSEKWPIEGLGELGLSTLSPHRSGGRFEYQVLEKRAEKTGHVGERAFRPGGLLF